MKLNLLGERLASQVKTVFLWTINWTNIEETFGSQQLKTPLFPVFLLPVLLVIFLLFLVILLTVLPILVLVLLLPLPLVLVLLFQFFSAFPAL